MPFFLQGLLIGLSSAAAVGPIGVLCIQRPLRSRPALSILSTGGAASRQRFVKNTVKTFRQTPRA